jgi:hypothetical protein
MDDCGPGTPPTRLFVTVTVRGDGILVDFDGTGSQTESGDELLHQLRALVLLCHIDPARLTVDGPATAVARAGPARRRARRAGSGDAPGAALVAGARHTRGAA